METSPGGGEGEVGAGAANAARAKERVMRVESIVFEMLISFLFWFEGGI